MTPVGKETRELVIDFDKKYPCLKGEENCGWIIGDRICIGKKESNGKCSDTFKIEGHEKLEPNWFYREEAIRRYLFDIQEVREAIDNTMPGIAVELKNMIKEKLGIKDEHRDHLASKDNPQA